VKKMIKRHICCSNYMNQSKLRERLGFVYRRYFLSWFTK